MLAFVTLSEVNCLFIKRDRRNKIANKKKKRQKICLRTSSMNKLYCAFD